MITKLGASVLIVSGIVSMAEVPIVSDIAGITCATLATIFMVVLVWKWM